jgi:hypothetical protein
MTDRLPKCLRHVPSCMKTRFSNTTSTSLIACIRRKFAPTTELFCSFVSKLDGLTSYALTSEVPCRGSKDTCRTNRSFGGPAVRDGAWVPGHICLREKEAPDAAAKLSTLLGLCIFTALFCLHGKMNPTGASHTYARAGKVMAVHLRTGQKPFV